MTVPSPRDLSALLEFAEALAIQAGEATLRRFGRRVAPETKPDGTPVTLADREAEEILRRGIRERFPEDAILGEEFGEEGSGAPYRWILDPIDGTRSFTCGVPLYAVLVGLEVQDEAALGIIHFPALGETVAAALGAGCYLDGVSCRVSDTATLGRSVALTSDPLAIAESPVAAGWRSLSRKVEYVRGWGDAYGHALVATGRAEIMVDPELAPWDAAPLLPVLEEAGGRFTSLRGERTIHGGSGVSTNGRLHDGVIERLSPPIS